MELQAALQCIHLSSPDPAHTAEFYCTAYGMKTEGIEGGYAAKGPNREIRISYGPANQLKYAQFRFNTFDAWLAFENRTSALKKEPLPRDLPEDSPAICVADPDGNLLVFTPPTEASEAIIHPVLPVADLQHFALRTPNLPALLAFYTDNLGFLLSDAVKDAEQLVRAAFLRTESLHHALALFAAPVACFDHQSFEAPDWAAMRVWGDHMASIRTPIVWGIGRHGPGNDVFFMVRDPDGNLVEISSEIEHCPPGRPAGVWQHEERTLNLWGKAIMRS